MLRILAIGDQHYKVKNSLETGIMHEEILKVIKREKPDCIVLLGDILDKFESINVRPFNRVISFLDDITKLHDNIVMLVGNHDRPNNNVFLTDEHPFNALKKWDNIKIVEKVEIYEVQSKTDPTVKGDFVFVPYVPVSRFREALETVGLSHPMENPDCDKKSWSDLKDKVGVFAHQEFNGVQMGVIKSTHGDLWHPDAPFLVSGHVHDYEQLKPNLYYTGTPFQHGYSDTGRKTISLFNYKIDDSRWSMVKEVRIDLNIPKKLKLVLKKDELLNYEVDSSASITEIKIEIEPIEHLELLKDPKIKKLLAAGVKIKPINPKTVLPTDGSIIFSRKIPFSVRLCHTIISGDKDLRTEFESLFGTIDETAVSNVMNSKDLHFVKVFKPTSEKKKSLQIKVSKPVEEESKSSGARRVRVSKPTEESKSSGARRVRVSKPTEEKSAGRVRVSKPTESKSVRRVRVRAK